MELGNIKFTTKATQLIKYADNIAKKNGFDAIHPIHLFLGSLKFDDEINLELKRMTLIDEMSIISKFKTSIQNKYSCKYEEIKDNDLANINISILTRNIIFEAKRVTELHEEHGQIFVSDGQILKPMWITKDIKT